MHLAVGSQESEQRDELRRKTMIFKGWSGVKLGGRRGQYGRFDLAMNKRHRCISHLLKREFCVTAGTLQLQSNSLASLLPV